MHAPPVIKPVNEKNGKEEEHVTKYVIVPEELS